MPDTLTTARPDTSRSSRYWSIDYAFPGESNRLCEVEEAAGLPMVALVDETEGGVIGYIGAAHINRVQDALNDSEEPEVPLSLGPALDYLYDHLTGMDGIERSEAGRLVDAVEEMIRETNQKED